MNLDALLRALGYLRSKRHWVTPESADPRLAHHYRLAHRAGEGVGDGAGVVGSYVYQTSLDDKLTPLRPAVFVAHAADDAQARAIQRRLWNLGDCPFIVMVLPGAVRVYTGFDYADKDLKRAIIAEERGLVAGERLPEALKSFHADAIDSGRIWEEQARYLGPNSRVDYQLLSNLESLSRELQGKYALAREVAHALIGKYIYFRYLRDRNILDDAWLGERGIRPEQVFGREATAQGFLALAEALEKQFNGDVFPLPAGDDGKWRTNDTVSFLARIFHGDTTGGQLALEFGKYDFSYIPVELLSSTYGSRILEGGKAIGE